MAEKDYPIFFQKEYKTLEELGCRIFWYPRRDGVGLDTPIDLSHIRTGDKKYVVHSLAYLMKYIKLPAIVDWHGDHEKRRKWYGELIRRDRGLFEASQENRLRGNHIGSVFSNVQMIVNCLEVAGGLAVVKKIGVLKEETKEFDTEGGENTLVYVDALSDMALSVVRLFLA